MHLTVIDKRKLKKEIQIPSSKSYANRALILASLKNAPVRIDNLNLCDDVLYLMKCLKEIGLNINDNIIENSFPACELDAKTLFVGDGGTTFRFLLPLLSLGTKEYSIEMSEQLASRPHAELLNKLRELNVKIQEDGNRITLQGPLQFKKIEVDSELSSQFASALKLIGVDLKVKNLESSQTYFKMTEKVIDEFKKSSHYIVPGDFSSAAFPIAFSFVHKMSIKLNNITRDPFQADEKILSLIQEHGAKVYEEEGALVINCEHRDEKGFEVDISDCLDLAPALSFMASFQKSESFFHNIKGLVVKESNRLLEIQKLLNHFSIETHVEEEQLKIIPHEIKSYSKDVMTSFDHRMVMTGILFLTSLAGGRINYFEAIQKSFPNFLFIFEN